MGGFIASISAVMKFLGLVAEMWDMYKVYRDEGWIVDGKKAIKQAKEAKTDEERINAAKAVSDWVTGMPG